MGIGVKQDYNNQMGQRVLIVDDAAFIREVLTQILLKNGFEIAGEATNGQEAVELAQQTRPDLIIMDIVMPEKSGIQATQEILETSPRVPIIACSTEGSETMVMKAMAAGCVDFVVKPFKVDDFVKTIRSVLDKQGEQNV